MDVVRACQEFHLLSTAGIIIPPPAMVKSIEKFVVGTYAKQFLKQFDYDIESRDNSLKLNSSDFTATEKTDINIIRHVLEREANKREESGVELLTSTKCFVDFDFAGWKSPYGQPDMIKAMLEAEDLHGITVEIRLNEHVENHKALWFGSRWMIYIFLPLPECNTIGDYKREALALDRVILDVRDTIEHELIHMVQDMGTYIKNMGKDMTGMPPKKVRAPEYSPGGWQREDVKHKGTRREHVLQDVEFYSNLHDALNAYRRIKELVPEEWQDEFLKVFIGAQDRRAINKYPKNVRFLMLPNHFLMALKWYDMNRWKEAVKRFVANI